MTKERDKSAEERMISEDEGNRESKIMNAVINTSIILMGTLMGGFSELMVNVGSEMASGMVEAFKGQESGDKVRSEIKQKTPKVTDEMKNMISGMRKDMYLQIEKNKKEIEPFLSDPTFDAGPRLIEGYDFGIPKLTQQLDDATIAQYTYLLVSEDATFAKLFGELTDWMKSLPSLPSKNTDK